MNLALVRRALRGVAGGATLAFTLAAGAALDVDSGRWQPGPSLVEARSGATAVRLADGRILLSGGLGADGAALASAELIGADGSSRRAPTPTEARHGHTATLLPDGRVLVAGGTGADGSALSSAEIYDPVFDYWAPIGGMVSARSGHQARALDDGRIVLSGGGVAPGSPALEVFDPADESFSTSVLQAVAQPRGDAASVVLGDGRVLVLGGSDGLVPLATTEFYDPTTGLVSEGPTMTAPRAKFAATRLLDGRVLVTGGVGPAGELDSAEIYDPETGAFEALEARLAAPRSGHLAMLLPDNHQVLIVSGDSGGLPAGGAELFLPVSERFVATGSPGGARRAAAGSPLAEEGRLLLAGGDDGSGPVAATEVYGFQTVRTDKPDYAPGEVVTISGRGWQPGELVALLLARTPKTAEDTSLLAAVGADGRFTTSDYLTTPADLGVLFDLTANGETSGLAAANRFTDGTLSIDGVFGTANDTAALTAARYSQASCGGAVNVATGTRSYTLSADGTSPLLTPSAIDAGSSYRLVAAATSANGGSFSNWVCERGSVASFPGGAGARDVCVTGQGNANGNVTTACVATYGAAAAVNTTTTITSDQPDPSVVGQAVTVNFSVARAGSPSTGAAPTGSVTVTVSGGSETCTGTLSGGPGTASGSCVFTLTSAGARTLTATYAGATGFNGSSDTEAHLVNPAATVTTATVTPEPSVVGLPYTVNVTVAAQAPGTGTPTGEVLVSANDGTSCTVAALVAGSGSCQITPTTAGSKQVTATYGSTANYAASTVMVAHTVNQGTTSTTINSDSPDPSVVGQPYTVTWTVAVTTGAGTPSGTVTVSDGLGDSCTGSVPTGSCQLTGRSAGGRTLTATYAGDTNFTGSSGIADHTVTKGQTTTTVAASPTPSRFGESVTFTATVCPAGAASGVPTGTVDFSVDGGAATPAMLVPGIGSCPTATYTTAGLPTGMRSISAAYVEDANFLGSQGSVQHTVQRVVTTTTITATSPAPSVVGEAVTISFTVALDGPGAGTPGGTVTVSAGPGEACTATLPATSCDITFTSAAVKSLVATYSGDGNFLSSFSASYPHTVNARATTTTVSFDPASVVVGQKAVATLTVTDAEPRGTATAPAGAVALSTVNASSLGGSPCTLVAFDNKSARCTVEVTPSRVDGGSHAFAAAYTPTGAVHAASTGDGSLTVTARATEVQVSLNPASVKVGKAATITVEVRDAAGVGSVSTPAGSIALSASVATDTLTACTLMPTATLGTASCTATVTPQAVAGGLHTITAAYTADAVADIHSGNSDSDNLTVLARATATTVTLSKSQIVVGEGTLATILVEDADGSGGSVPRGSIAIDTGNASDTLSGPCVLPASGPATCSVTITPTRFANGSRQVSATYTPNDDIHAGSTAAPAALAVAKRATTTSVAVSPIQVVTGQPTQATVTVTDSAGIGLASTPAGTLVLLSNGVGDIVGSCTLNAAATCTASVTPTRVGTGSRTISASYTANDDVHLDSNGSAGLSVIKADTVTTLTSSPNPSVFGGDVTFTATVCVQAPGSGTPGGTVNVSVDGAAQAATLVAGAPGCAVATQVRSGLLAGNRLATAAYAGNADFNASDSATLTQVVQKLAATTTVTVTTPKQYSDLATFTATVAPAVLFGQSPAAAVDFYVGSQKMGSANVIAGTATLDAALLETVAGQMAPGSRTVKAVFTGVNPNFTVADATTTLVIDKEDARATYTGAMYVGTSSATATTGVATLAATIQDISVTADANGDTYAGDIRKATMKFVDRANGATLCSATIGLVSASDTRTGVATCNATLSVGSCPSAPCSQQYTVGVVVDGYYVNGADGDSVVTIAQPGNGFITGGGYLSLVSSAGEVAGGVGTRNNFGFNVKYNKQKTNLQGNINTIIRRNGRVYQIKGNSMTSLAVQTTTAGGTATFNGKASITDITVPTAPLSVDGNASLQVTMTDNGEPGASDAIGITVFNKAGGLFFSSNWSGTRTVEQTLAGGNLVVR